MHLGYHGFPVTRARGVVGISLIILSVGSCGTSPTSPASNEVCEGFGNWQTGDAVEIGALVGHSGNTGNTGNKPHLHLSIQSCDPVSLGTDACATVPMNFRNSDPNPTGLVMGQRYEARF